MNILFSTVLKDLEGENLQEFDKIEKLECEECKKKDAPFAKKLDITLRRVSTNALQSAFKSEENIAAEEKIKRYELAKKIVKAKDSPVDLSTDDVVLIKQCMNKLYGTLVVGPAFDILEGKDA